MWSANSVHGYPLASMEGKAVSLSSPYGVEVVIHLVMFLGFGAQERNEERRNEKTREKEGASERASERERERETERERHRP